MTNTSITPAISSSNVTSYCSNVSGATAYRFGVVDSAGHEFHSPSIIEMVGQSHKYAAVYHSSVSGYFSVNLAVSNDLINWTFLRTLINNASMPKMVQVAGAAWILVMHENWMTTDSSGASAGPCRIGYELFYDLNDLLAGTIRSTWIAPQFSADDHDGTPSIYNASLALSGGYYVVNGQYGFHSLSGGNVRDINSVTTTTDLFSPAGTVSTLPSSATTYNSLLTTAGAAGSIGQRDTLQTTTARYNLQEGNLTTANDFGDWRIWLYTFGDSHSYPTGVGTASQLSITTPGGSTSFGNPSVNVVNSPSGSGTSLVVSYMVFTEGAAAGEAGSLVYYYDL